MVEGLFTLGYLLIQGIIEMSATESTNKNNRLMMREQNQFNADEAQKTREWESIGAQMERAEDAGVNPVAVAMQNGMTFGGSSSAQASASPTIPFQSPLSAFANALNTSMQTITTGSYAWEQSKTERAQRQPQIDQMKATAEQLKATTNNLNLDAHYKNIVNEYERDMREWTLNGMKADFELTYAEQNKMYKEIERMDVELEKIWQDIMLEMAQEQLIDAETQKTLTDTHLNYLRMDEVLATIDNINANTSLVNEQANGIALDSDEKALQLGLKKKYATKYMNAYEAQLEAISANCKRSVRDCNWFIFDKLFNRASQSVHNSMGLGTAGGAVVGAVGKLAVAP